MQRQFRDSNSLSSRLGTIIEDRQSVAILYLIIIYKTIIDDHHNLEKLELKTGNDYGYLSLFTCRLIYCAFEFIIWIFLAKFYCIHFQQNCMDLSVETSHTYSLQFKFTKATWLGYDTSTISNVKIEKNGPLDETEQTLLGRPLKLKWTLLGASIHFRIVQMWADKDDKVC